MNRLTYILLTMVMLTALSSCSKFDSFNTNPDAPSTVTPGMLATGVLRGAFRFWNPNPADFTTLNLWLHHIANADGTPNPSQYFYSYGPSVGFGAFQNLTNLKRMVELAKGNPGEPSYQGLALFMKAYYGFTTSVVLGDIPYSEAGKAEEGITKPKYDKQADVFAAVLADLQAAEALFAAGKNFDGDMIHNGEALKWRKLCNALQLKVLQTMSKKITTAQKSRFAEIVAAGNLMTGNTDNFKLTYTTGDGAGHPFWSGETRRNYVVVSELTINSLKMFNDRRLFYFADPAPYLMTAAGGSKAENDPAAYQGVLTSLNAGTIAINTQAGKYSYVNLRYTKDKIGDPMLIFSYSEQCFIIAEAIEEGWVPGGAAAAKTYYENGVKEILKYYMGLPITANHGMPITQSYIDNYFTGAAAYQLAGTKTDRLRQIWTQRWLLDFFQGNSFNNYPQILRTGYPVLPLDPATNMNPDDKTLYPKRWKYDVGEQVTNPVNYKQAIDSQYGGYDGINGIPWYLQP
uniref:SusD/RagB family nutrient-binding outer membrane lipoprotein n=1 Tax=Pedobacter schmidteae TaxID=2201271 RepID=UPI000EB00E5D|nr:SusD/RagB family nutrient-binding outer membrane lipoprotein [Pedobacter schmidteae]